MWIHNVYSNIFREFTGFWCRQVTRICTEPSGHWCEYGWTSWGIRPPTGWHRIRGELDSILFYAQYPVCYLSKALPLMVTKQPNWWGHFQSIWMTPTWISHWRISSWEAFKTLASIEGQQRLRVFFGIPIPIMALHKWAYSWSVFQIFFAINLFTIDSFLNWLNTIRLKLPPNTFKNRSSISVTLLG